MSKSQKPNTLTEENLNRLALGIIEKNQCSYPEALQVLGSLKLYVRCGESIRKSPSQQAALLTIVNTGKRAFLGGVFVAMPPHVRFTIPWPPSNYLNSVVADLSGTLIEESEIGNNFTINIGIKGSIDENSIEVVCNGWVGGISNGIDPVTLNTEVDFSLGGIFAGALAVSSVFIRLTNIKASSCDRSVGLSLWRPDIDWWSAGANGPELKYLPRRIWLLGLGHLGQAYAWTLGLLTFEKPRSFQVLLQDFDFVTDGNYSSGLLSELRNCGVRKTRLCAQWLEAFGITTAITERKYDRYTHRVDEEPFVALCGFDNAQSRRLLEESGFDLVIESAVGSGLDDFDSIITHSFPNSNRKPTEIWDSESKSEVNKSLVQALQEEVNKEACGVLVENLASKAMSASFVGAMAATLVVSEVLRGLNGGKKYESIVAKTRSIENRRTIEDRAYTTELARNGFTTN